MFIEASMTSRKKVDFLIYRKILTNICFNVQGKDVIKNPVITLRKFDNLNRG